MRRMATLLWWIRSVGSDRRSVPFMASGADWAHRGRVPFDTWRASTTSVRGRSSPISSEESLTRKVRADMASTRWRTMPAVGSGNTSSTRVPGPAGAPAPASCPSSTWSSSGSVAIACPPAQPTGDGPEAPDRDASGVG